MKKADDRGQKEDAGTQDKGTLVNCPTHPNVKLLCPACTGAKGGVSKSKKKLRAALRNAKKATAARKGGRHA